MEKLKGNKLYGMIVSVIISSVIFYLIWMYYVKKRAYKLCGHYVHTPFQVPVLGNAFIFSALKKSTDLWNFVTEWSDKYKNGVMMWLFHMPWLFIQELDAVEAVLSSSECVEKAYVYRLLNTITDGVFSANGIRWKKLRKKLNLTFSQKQLDMVYDDLNDEIAICINVLKQQTDKYINIISYIMPYFFDTVAKTHFGVKFNEQTERDYLITEVASRLIELSFERRLFTIQYHNDKIFEFSRVFQYINTLRRRPLDFVRKKIGERLMDAEMEKVNLADKKKIYYVDLAKEALEELNIQPSWYNIERNTGDILIAGSDTTSVAVCACFYWISLYPEIQEKIYEEVLPIYGDKSVKELTREDINKMEYLEMVLKESLRHTAPPGIVRELKKDLDVGKYTIPKNTNVYIVMKSIHKDPKYYERAEEFYPEHFLPEKIKERPKFAFIPFSYGPRNCPGMTYSYITMKSIISAVVRNFKLETNIPLKDIQYKLVLMQEHKNGYYLKLTPRL